jgi:hypothetical protein
MAATERRDLMRALCQDAGNTGPPDVLVEDWDATHACWCALYLDHAAQGDTKTLTTMRTCMGLSVVPSTSLGAP